MRPNGKRSYDYHRDQNSSIRLRLHSIAYGCDTQHNRQNENGRRREVFNAPVHSHSAPATDQLRSNLVHENADIEELKSGTAANQQRNSRRAREH